MSSSLLQMGMDNWELCRGVMDHAVRLQAWLGGNVARQGSPGGGSGEFGEEWGSSSGFRFGVGMGSGEDWRRGSVASTGSGSDGGRTGSLGEGGMGKGKEKMLSKDGVKISR